MQQQHPSQRRRSRREPRKYTSSFSTIDWGFRSSLASGDNLDCDVLHHDDDVDSYEGGMTLEVEDALKGGGEEAGRSTIVSQDSTSSDTNKKNHQRLLRTAFDSFKGSVIKGIFAHHDEESIHDDDESLTDKPNATARKNKHHQQQPLQQHKKSAAAALVHHPPSSQLDESEISVDDDGFLDWDRTKRTFTKFPPGINNSVSK